MKWRDVVRDYQNQYWNLLDKPSMFALEVFVSSTDLTTKVLDWLPNLDKKMKIRIKFHTLPCIEIKRNVEENLTSANKHSKINVKEEAPTEACDSQNPATESPAVPPVNEIKGFDPTRCLVKEKQEPPVPKVHKLPGEADSDTESKKGTVNYKSSNSRQKESTNLSNQSSSSSDSGTKISSADTKATNKTDTVLKTIPFNNGQTVIFASSPAELLYTLMKVPLAVNFFVDGPTLIGNTFIALQQFAEAVSLSLDSYRNIPCSAILDEKFSIYNKKNYVGYVHLDLRLTCLGYQVTHPLTDDQNPNDEKVDPEKPTESLRVLKLNGKSRPYKERANRLLKSERVTEHFHPAYFKAALSGPPMILEEDFDEYHDGDTDEDDSSEDELPPTKLKPKKIVLSPRRAKREWLRYKCTDVDTIIQRKVLEDHILKGKPPFQKGSPFRGLVCPAYLKSKNIDWSEETECQCGKGKMTQNIQYIPCPNQKQGQQSTIPQFEYNCKGNIWPASVNNQLDDLPDCPSEMANPNYDPYMQSAQKNFTSQQETNCHMKSTYRSKDEEEIDPEEALNTVAGINKKVEHWKKVLEDLVLDSEIQMRRLDALEHTNSKHTVEDNEEQLKKEQVQIPYDQISEQMIPQIVQHIPDILASSHQEAQKYNHRTKEKNACLSGRFSSENKGAHHANEQWQQLKEFCKCTIHQ